MSITDEAPPPTAGPMTAEQAFLERLHALKVTAVRLAGERDQARKDRAAVVHQNLMWRRRVEEQDDEIRALLDAGRAKDLELERHRAAAQARAAVEAAQPRPRPLSGREQLFATLVFLGALGSVCGLLTSLPALFIGGLTVGFVSACALALSRSKPAKEPLLDLDEAVDRG